MTKRFWSEKRAREFAEHLELCGAESVEVWTERDRLNDCTVYIVKWYE